MSCLIVVVAVALLGGAASARFSPTPTPTPSMSGSADPEGVDDAGTSGVPPPADTAGGTGEPGLPVPAVLFSALGLVGVLLLARRRRAGRVEADEEDVPGPSVAVVVAEARSRLEAGDVTSVVIDCWTRLAEIAGLRGVERSPNQTAAEFAEQVAVGLALPRGAVRRLAGLFERTWYAEDGPTGDDADEARACLDELVTSLSGEVKR